MTPALAAAGWHGLPHSRQVLECGRPVAAAETAPDGQPGRRRGGGADQPGSKGWLHLLLKLPHEERQIQARVVATVNGGVPEARQAESAGRRMRPVPGVLLVNPLCLAEGERVGLSPWIEECDLEGAAGDGARLADELVQPLLGKSAVALAVHVGSVRLAGRLPV